MAERLEPISLEQMWGDIFGGVKTVINYIRYVYPLDKKASALLQVWDAYTTRYPDVQPKLDDIIIKAGLSRADFAQLAVGSCEIVGETYIGVLKGLAKVPIVEASITQALEQSQLGQDERKGWLQHIGIFPTPKAASININATAQSANGGFRSLEETYADLDTPFTDAEFNEINEGEEDSNGTGQNERERGGTSGSEGTGLSGGEDDGTDERNSRLALPATSAIPAAPVPLPELSWDHVENRVPPTRPEQRSRGFEFVDPS